MGPDARAYHRGARRRRHESAAYILKFAAWCLQNPGERAEVALVFRGEKGTGKGTFARALKDIFGQHGLHIFSAKHLTGNFNAHLRTCLLLFSDEAFWAGDKQGESTLKGLLDRAHHDDRAEGRGRGAVEEPPQGHHGREYRMGGAGQPDGAALRGVQRLRQIRRLPPLF
jgi:hypothetical protein